MGKHGCVSLPSVEVPIVDDVAVMRLRQLRDQVARPGEDVLGELLSLFERDAHARIAVLRAVASASREGSDVATDPHEARRQAAHALKGAAGNIGASRVAATAAHVEKNVVGPETIDLLQQEVDAALTALRARLT